MIYASSSRRQSHGFTLIEALIAVVIIAVGLLAVAKFQSSLVSSSGSSKARAEAVALAQQKVDEVRNYINQPELVSKLRNINLDSTDTFQADILSYLDSQAGDTATVTEAATIAGVNADFTRSWNMTAASGAVTVVVDVKVSWTDPKTGNTDEVVLSTNVLYRSPEEVAALASDSASVDGYPTSSGNAKEGTGKYGSIPAGAEQNDDGSYTYTNLAQNRVELIDANGYILLRIEDACDNGACITFSEISGYVWLEDSDADIDVSNIFVANTPGAACVENKTALVDTGDYSYFPYTCYMGGNWFGNISILHEESVSNKKANVCVGDPVTNGGYGMNGPKFSGRRSYRGLMSQDYYQGAGASTVGNDLVLDDENSDGVGNFRTVGVQDELILPSPHDANINANYNSGYRIDPSGNAYLPGHNFLALDLGNNDDDAGCKGVMENESEFLLNIYDASGNDTGNDLNAFANTPDDFVCLNQSHYYETTDASGNSVTDAIQPYWYTSDTRLEEGYLAADNDQIIFETITVNASGNTILAESSVISADASGNVSSTNIINNEGSYPYFMDTAGCGFNPSLVPEFTHTITGSISNSNGVLVSDAFVVNTSDDQTYGTAGNCTVTDRSSMGSGKEIADYSCTVFHTYDSSDSTGIGWEGNVLISVKNGSCTTPTDQAYSFAGSAVTANVTNKNFGCTVTSSTKTSDLTTVKTLNSADSTPEVGDTVQFKIVVANDGPDADTNVKLTDAVPGGFTFISAVASQGTYASGSGLWTIGSLAKDASVNIVIDASVNAGTEGTTLTNITTAAAGDNNDPGTTGDSLSASVSVVATGEADLQTDVTLSSGDGTPQVGDQVQYTVTVTNNGPVAATTVSLTHDAWPTELGYVSSNASTGTYTSGTRTWAMTTLAVDASATLVLDASVNSGTVGDNISFTIDASNVAKSVAPGVDSIASDDRSETITIGSSPVADIETDITLNSGDSTPQAGDALQYLVTIKNNGGDPATNLSFTSKLSSDSTYLSHTASTGTAAHSSGTVTWSGFNLSVGASATLQVNASVNAAVAVGTTITYDASSATATETDNTTSGDDLTESVVVASNLETVNLLFSFTKYDTTASITNTTAYSVTGTTVNSGDGNCTPASGNSINCSIQVNPSTSAGVAVQFTYSKTVCDYASRISGTTISSTGTKNAIWYTAYKGAGTHAINVDLAKNNGSCP